MALRPDSLVAAPPHAAAGADQLAPGAPDRPLVDARGEPLRICFLVNVDWFFLSHRLPLARAARRAGAHVTVAAADTGCGPTIRAEGFEFAPIAFSRKGTGPRAELATLLSVAALYRRLRPHLVHQVTIKPVLYGSLAARALRVPAVVNAISGLGYVFIAGASKPGLLRRLVGRLYAIALRNPRGRTIFQNPDDRALFVEQGLVDPSRTVLIRGSGVDCARFAPTPEPPGLPVVMLPARMLWDKGVQAFVDAARMLRERGVAARFVLVGDTDAGNPSAVPTRDLDAWTADGVVEWWGARDDMHAALPEASIVVLPSRREGLPKVLLEAAACARPMIAADVPGCREVVRPGETGLLFPVDDAAALATALTELLESPETRARFGRAARVMAETEFAEDIVADRTMALYRELLLAPV